MKTQILDTTIRDGSYAVDFKFSCKDVKDLASKSNQLGIDYIEIGHGQGLHASSAEHGFSLHTDVEYMKAAKEGAENAKYGFFCIPGIAQLEDIHIAKAHGMYFIRIGVNANDYKGAVPYIEKARTEGLYVAVNYMKSYAVQPDELAGAAEKAWQAGAQCAYIVDSAGCMEAAAIGEYIDAIRDRTPIAIGFHGHNNLGLAVSNTVYCAHKDIDFIDCSFQGLGRSCGNASLEQVVMILEKEGYNTGFDIPRVLEYGYAGLRNIVPAGLTNPLDYMCGYAGFHSGFLRDIYRCVIEKQVDPLRLILAYSKLNQTGIDYKELQMTADALPRDIDDNPYGFGEYFSEKYNEG